MPRPGKVGASTMALLLFIAQKTIPSVNASLLESYVPIQVLGMTICAGHKATPREIAGIVLGWNKAQEHLPVRHLSFMEYFTPLVAAITAVILLNEPITLFQWLGTVVISFSASLL